MLPERKAALDELGFEWDPRETDWAEGYRSLLAYREREGHCRVPHQFRDGDGFKLGYWVATQRFRRDKMPPERQVALDALGFDWGKPQD